ncbi:hypothetical protein [Nocardiopsis aegyptia]|uniref:PRC-barrel domain-containing protein n=1 Tax=Nocardiopsis aegyptia TaxID=220378 RepID=A0A7Z0J9B0_9ACTN|nr:hypothetical protein [Nocardiopsis aegyptia]NYJ33978.1 hypothetical protein [Nocardiopsis aegyptia]
MEEISFRVGFVVLDRQILDRDGRPAGKVDDVELTWEEGGGPPVMSALLTDSAALGPRISGRAGRIWRSAMRRLRPSVPEPARIAVEDVTAFSPSARLSTAAPEQVGLVEEWLRDHLIGRIPGARRGDDAGE